MEKELTQEQIVRAATNDPSLAQTEFILGERTFPIVDLAYEDYIKFVALMQPLLAVIAGGVASAQGIDLGAAFDLSQIMTYLSDNLPEMVRLVCAQTDPTITVEWVKKEGRNPIRLAKILLLQINQNKIIADLADFFALILPLVRQAKTAMRLNSTTEETP